MAIKLPLSTIPRSTCPTLENTCSVVVPGSSVAFVTRWTRMPFPSSSPNAPYVTKEHRNSTSTGGSLVAKYNVAFFMAPSAKATSTDVERYESLLYTPNTSAPKLNPWQLGLVVAAYEVTVDVAVVVRVTPSGSQLIWLDSTPATVNEPSSTAALISLVARL
jgi:hypothetical protein